VRELPQVGTLVVKAPKAAKARLAASVHAAGVASDHIETIVPPEAAGRTPQHRVLTANASGAAPSPDPAFSLPGLMWNEQRVNMLEAWTATAGDRAVTVGVADTGLDFTHSELAPKITSVVDFTTTEDPPICKTFVAAPNNKSDADWAAIFGGPATTDWNGHGSWIGGNIAAVLDGSGVNGIAPKVDLVALKISQWCGSAYDSEILAAFLYAADHGINIVSISFGGYLDKNDPDQALVLRQYDQVVKYANSKGTTIVAAAGNEHVRVNGGGKVVSHGPLTTPGTVKLDDLFGQYEVPGGVAGVVDVAATGNMVNASSATCPAPAPGDTNFVCKPASDPHQQTGVGSQDQLAYYSNYGPRIDVAAPGGARKFNLPVWDKGGTPGWPYTTADGFTAWEAFSTTSNWALQIPCFEINGGGFPAHQCYSTIQGTSMATPHASAVLALIASAKLELAHDPAALVKQLRKTARNVTGNATAELSATDLSGGDATGGACPTGYCHLGGPAIPDKEAYGAGIVDAAAAVKR
jgi:lantibiotic leader peptide-processing serine protease